MDNPERVTELSLSNGMVALIDTSDYARVGGYKWTATWHKHTWYAHRYTKTNDGKRRHIYLHQEVLDVGPGERIDHRDHNGLNCARSNLRHATQSQNVANGSHRKRRSRFRGVQPGHKSPNWTAQITVNGRLIRLGTFRDEEAAGRAYDAAAAKAFGEFATLNFSGE